jgi:uncharacterized membrane protein
MKSLLEYLISAALAIALIAATYSYLGAWLTALVSSQFDKLLP